MNSLEHRALLDAYHREVSAVIIDKQHPVSGLLPASTAVNTHGDYRDAWVRDNVYSILAVWGLGLAYRSLDDDDGRGRELEQRTVQLMRGLLRSMMSQSAKVEVFKHTRDPRDSLHAKYQTETGSTVVGDDAWGHLQIDATSVFLLQLAQMISSGLDIVWTLDEVHFVQNLVYYVERAYRTPDFGIWERGAKSNHGRVELNASSLGMAKAALEALDGFNLFGARGSHRSVIHVSPDNIAQADITLSAMLPRESFSKEVDAAVLSVVGYPAFAVHDAELRDRTRQEIIDKLQGPYGLKRFLRDGHQTVLEDEGRLHYEAEELHRFENIESEWPLFYTYLYLDALLRHDRDQAADYRERLGRVVVEREGQLLLPELYFVTEENIEAERAAPGSTQRAPNENVPLVWAQSLFLLGRMLEDGLLQGRDIDPLGRRRHKKPSAPVVQVLLLAEDDACQAELAAHGVRAETLEDIAPIRAFVDEDISLAHGVVGANQRLGLTGRSARALKSLTTSRFYHLDQSTVVCLAPFFLQRNFYLGFDLEYLVQRFERELAYLRRHWTQAGRPTVCLLLTHSLLATDRKPLFSLIRKMESGHVGDVPVVLGRLVELLPTSSYERLDGVGHLELPRNPVESLLHPPHALQEAHGSAPLSLSGEREIEAIEDRGALTARLLSTHNLYEQIEILASLVADEGIEGTLQVEGGPTSLRQLVEEVYEAAGQARLWGVVRRAAGLLDKTDVDLALSCAALLVAHKAVQVGRAYSAESLISEPLPDQELFSVIARFCRDDPRDRVITQEMLLHLGLLVRARPELFAQMYTVRVSHIVGLLTGQLARERSLPVEDAFEALLGLAPSEIQRRLEEVLSHYAQLSALPQELEHLTIKQGVTLSWKDDLGQGPLSTPEGGWLAWRQAQGVLDRLPKGFFPRTWEVFKHVPSLTIGDKLERKNRIESSLVVSDMTPGEQAFALFITHLLNKIPAPEYRQLNIEALTTLGRFFEQNVELQVSDPLYLDAVIGHAVRLSFLAQHPELSEHYDEHKVQAWQDFYAAAPHQTSASLVAALRFLLGEAQSTAAQ